MTTENDRVYLSETEQRYVERLIMSDQPLDAKQWKLTIAYLTTAPFTSSAEEWEEIARQDAEVAPGLNELAEEVSRRGPEWTDVAARLRAAATGGHRG